MDGPDFRCYSAAIAAPAPLISRAPCEHRFDDVVIARAAADIAFELFADRVLVELRALAVDDVDRRHDHARRAEAALQAVIVLERLLHRMQLAALGEPFDRRDVRASQRGREHGAGLDRASVDMDDAGAALRGVAADMRAGQAEILAQELHQQRARVDIAPTPSCRSPSWKHGS